MEYVTQNELFTGGIILACWMLCAMLIVFWLESRIKKIEQIIEMILCRDCDDSLEPHSPITQAGYDEAEAKAKSYGKTPTD